MSGVSSILNPKMELMPNTASARITRKQDTGLFRASFVKFILLPPLLFCLHRCGDFHTVHQLGRPAGDHGISGLYSLSNRNLCIIKQICGHIGLHGLAVHT